MRNLKKFLALVLAMMMAFSLMVTANASQDKNAQDIYPDASSVDEAFVEAVDVLYGMGVMTGDSGNVYGDRPIMRSEMATILYRLMTGDTGRLKNQLYADIAAERFIDVQSTDWFAPYIGWCYDAGLMIGSNGYVRPWANVTGYEAEVMVLRAMGYGKNHEYTGTGWSVNASSDATIVGLLKDIRNTHYANTLSQNSRRDVVASIVFQAAQLPTVSWSPSLGYNKYVGVAVGTGGNILNPSLGEINFGLTSHYGIVVGNQATGEPGAYSTKIGFSVKPTITKGLDIGDDLTDGSTNAKVKGFLTDAVITDAIDDEAYYYLSDNNATTGTAKNVTLSFDWKTDLRLFNHAVKVWYDNRGNGATATVAIGSDTGSGSVSFGTNCKTYALYDQAKTVVVTTNKTSDSDVTTAHLATLANGIADNDNNWSSTRLRNAGSAFFNYAFDRMSSSNKGANASAGSAVSPIKENDEGTGSKHGLYLLISNDGTYINVVISLNMTFTQVVQRNTTTYPTSVGVLNANGLQDTNDYFGDSDDQGRLTDVIVGTSKDYISLIEDAILDTEDGAKALGAKVAAIEITGTYGNSPTPGTVGRADPAFGSDYIVGSSYTDGSTFYYNLTKHSRFKTVKVIKVDTDNNDVYTNDPEMPVIHQSVFAEATDATFTDQIEGYTGLGSIQFRLIAGRDYTFTLDESDNYIYWETPGNTSNFVYGTYIDFTTKLASGIFDYPLVHVDTNGQQQTKNVTSIDTNAMGAVEYDRTNLNKRDANATVGNNSGYKTGKYIGFAMSDDGALTTVGAATNPTGYVQDDGTYFGSAVTIGARNVAVGAAEVQTGSNMFLTENTQFYIVDGAGQPTQTVKSIKGISKLMEGMTSVVLHGESGYLTSTNIGDYLDVTLCGNPYEMFYYQAGRFDYDQNYDASALEVKTIFLPAVCVEWNESTNTSLVFVGDSTATMINANNNNWATQFTVWRNGEPSNVWIQGDYTDSVTTATLDAYTIVDNGDNVFYELEATSKKATDGETIYKIKAVSNPADNVLGYYWDGAAVQVNAAAWTDTTLVYKATTFNQQAAYITDKSATSPVLYNVGNAGIKNLDTDYYPGIKDNNLTTLNGAGSLANNDGVAVSCILDNKDPQHLQVTFIYVNANSETLMAP